MRVAVLPREVAARAITGSIARSAWAVNAANLALTIPLLIDFAVRENAPSALQAPLAILVGMLALSLGAYFFPRGWVVACYLVVAAVGAALYQLTLIASHPGIVNGGTFLLNRPAVSLVLVGVVAATTFTGVMWIAAGLIDSFVVAAVVAVAARVPFNPGWGPVLFFTVYLVGFVLLHAIQASQRRLLPNFGELEKETSRLGVEESMRSRVASIVHDTLLNDLSIVMTAPDDLDDRMRARLREDLQTLRSAEWLHESAAVVVTDDQDSEMRNQLMLMISDLQWRGLTVNITGSGTGIYRLAPDAATAVVNSIRTCFENVLRHSGATVADLDLAYSREEVTIMVSDQGRGFEPNSVADDRLGLRESVVERIRSVGGSVRIWSTPGAGTSIVMRVPVVEIVEHERSRHEQLIESTTERSTTEHGTTEEATDERK
ncbi:MAG: ATP-binding protein [Rhodoglobus sp.]